MPGVRYHSRLVIVVFLSVGSEILGKPLKLDRLAIGGDHHPTHVDLRS